MSHLRAEDALAVVALPEHEPERVDAYRHAQACPQCATLLREHEAMLQLLDGAFAPAPVSPALSARVQARVYPQRWPRLVLLALWLVSLALVLIASGGGEELAAAVGSHCVLSEALFAVAPLGAGAWLSRAGRVRLEPVGFAIVTGGGGLVGQLWLRNHCAVHGATLHAFVFHFVVLLALSLLGGVIGPRLSLAKT